MTVQNSWTNSTRWRHRRPRFSKFVNFFTIFSLRMRTQVQNCQYSQSCCISLESLFQYLLKTVSTVLISVYGAELLFFNVVESQDMQHTENEVAQVSNEAINADETIFNSPWSSLPNSYLQMHSKAFEEINALIFCTIQAYLMSHNTVG